VSGPEHALTCPRYFSERRRSALAAAAAAAVPGPTREELAKIIYAFASDEPQWWIPCADEILRRFGSALCKETPYGELAISELPCKHGRTACIECGRVTTAFTAKETTGVPMILDCPACHRGHIDEDEWATRLHRTHRCAHCKNEWRPANVATVGVIALDSAETTGLGSRADALAEDVRANILRDLRFHRGLAAECRAHGVGDFRIGRAEGIDESADYVQNAVHDGTLNLIDRRDRTVCEAPGNGDYGVCGATAFVFVPHEPVNGQECRGDAFCLHDAADYLREHRYGESATE